MMQAKRLLGIVVGSNDPEQHQKSFDDGEEAAKMIEDFGKFETCIIEVSNKGPWMLHKDGDKASLDKEKFTSVVKKKRVKPDVVLLMTRGKIGECGEIQAYFDKQGVPFTFSGVEETKTTFNKNETVKMLKEEGLPVVKSILVENCKSATEELFDSLRTQVGFPCIVKPNKGCGSTGVSKVHSRKEIKEAIDFAFKHDSQVVIEPCVTDGVEVTCTVHDITGDELLEAFPVTEITPEGEVFHSTDYTNKTSIMTPTKNLRGEVVHLVTKVAKVAYRALNLCGLASFDMIVQDELPIILEVNAVPDIGPRSLVARQVKAGLSIQWQRNIPKFYSILVEHSIKMFPVIQTKKKIGGGARGM